MALGDQIGPRYELWSKSHCLMDGRLSGMSERGLPVRTCDVVSIMLWWIMERERSGL